MTGPTPETPEGSGRNNDNSHNTSIEQIQNHITTLKALIHEHNSRGGTPIKPIQLDFDEEESQDDGTKKDEEQPSDDLFEKAIVLDLAMIVLSRSKKAALRVSEAAMTPS